MIEFDPGKMTIEFKGTESDPRYVLGINGYLRFQTVGGNDEANAKELLIRWNHYETLVDICKYVKDLLTEGVGQTTYAIAMIDFVLTKIDKEKRTKTV